MADARADSVPLLLGLVADLFIAARIEDTARALGFAVRWIERAGQVAAPDAPGSPVASGSRYPGEPLTGQTGAFIALLVELQPVLLLVDLNNDGVPWEQWIAALKSSAATRRLPVLAFGSHMDVESHARATSAGADAVLAKSRFSQAMPDLIQKYSRISDEAAIAADCEGDLSAKAIHGLELMNAGEYFEAHEELEHAWNEEPGPARELYRAVLQVAVAYLQITRRNYNGALKMFLRVRQWLDPLPDSCRGVNVAALRAGALAARQHLEALGPERIGEFDLSLLRPVLYEKMWHQ